MSALKDWWSTRQKDMVEVRRHLHQNPELSGKETSTQAFLKYRLKTSWPDKLWEVADTGLVAEYHGKEEGPCVMVRVDIDALPISDESLDVPYASHNEGVAHKCGHDGHSTIGLGLAHYIAQHRPKKGKVAILFQPAEETAQGAKAVLEDKNFKLTPDFILALHNVPKFPKKSIVVIRNHFSASVRSVIIQLKGCVAHAAEPEQGRSPDMALCELLQYAKDQTHNAPDEESFQLLTPIYMNMGQKAYGTSPGHGELHLTCRSWSPEQMKQLTEQLEEKLAAVAKKYKLESDIKYIEIFPAVRQNDQLVDALEGAIDHLDFEAIHQNRPFRWGEDFGAFSREFPCLMFGLGAGEEQPVLHHPTYDFPDEIIPDGIMVFSTLIDELLNS